MSPVEVVDIILHAGVRRLWLWLLWDHPHSVSREGVSMFPVLVYPEIV